MASRTTTLVLLPRRAFVAAPFLQTRSFSSTLLLQAANPKDAVRHNPLVGNYTPATPATADKPAVSTEHPNATTTPSPDRSPVSSAEVAPNADLPPRPPPAATASSRIAMSGSNRTPARFPYDASRATAATTPNTGSAADGAPASTKRSTSVDFLSLLNTRNSIHSPLASLDPLARPKVRSAAVTGRTVFIKGFNGDNAATSPPQAIAMLNRLVKKQGVKAKFNYQRFHERRGMKVKRLRMKRWRMQFKKGFRETVRRVMELKRQGW